jgi:hypothetical protein
VFNGPGSLARAFSDGGYMGNNTYIEGRGNRASTVDQEIERIYADAIFNAAGYYLRQGNKSMAAILLESASYMHHHASDTLDDYFVVC